MDEAQLGHRVLVQRLNKLNKLNPVPKDSSLCMQIFRETCRLDIRSQSQLLQVDG